MATRASSGARPRRRRTKRSKLAKLWPTATTRRRWMRHFRRAPGSVRVVTVLVIVAGVWLATNWVYQVIRKPSELFFPVSGTLFKTPTGAGRGGAPGGRGRAARAGAPGGRAAGARGGGAG